MAKKQATPLSQEAIDALRVSSFTDNTFKLPEGQLDCYPEIKLLMAAIGGKWAGGKKRMEFAPGVDCSVLVSAACDRGEIPASNPLDFFPTPPDIVSEIESSSWTTGRWDARIIVAEIDNRPVRYLEPNGGSGALVAVMAAKMRPHDELVVCEKNPLLAGMLRTRFPQAQVHEGDFLEYTDGGKFDVILMNPPFDGRAYRKHVEHAESMLDRLGMLVSIVPATFKTHGDDFLYNVASRGEWQDLGADRFEDAKVATTAIFIENDPDAGWREKPFEGYSTHHAWDAAMSIGNDSDMRKKLARATNFAEATGLLQRWASQMLRDGNCIRVDEAIARETMTSIVHDYVAPDLAHLLPAEPSPNPAQPDDEAVAMHALSAPNAPEIEPAPRPPAAPTKAEQCEFALV